MVLSSVKVLGLLYLKYESDFLLVGGTKSIRNLNMPKPAERISTQKCPDMVYRAMRII